MKFGFTLAEVLITLGIVGVVASITLPTLNNNVQKQTYEAGFMNYLGNKFAPEYVNTQDGKIAANNLLTTIKQ